MFNKCTLKSLKTEWGFYNKFAVKKVLTGLFTLCHIKCNSNIQIFTEIQQFSMWASFTHIHNTSRMYLGE